MLYFFLIAVIIILVSSNKEAEKIVNEALWEIMKIAAYILWWIILCWILFILYLFLTSSLAKEIIGGVLGMIILLIVISIVLKVVALIIIQVPWLEKFFSAIFKNISNKIKKINKIRIKIGGMIEKYLTILLWFVFIISAIFANHLGLIDFPKIIQEKDIWNIIYWVLFIWLISLALTATLIKSLFFLFGIREKVDKN